jgi:phospholipase C
MINRRDALKRLGAFAGAAVAAPHVLTGCDDPGEGAITHFVLVCMENRSYDHYFGARAFAGKPGDGLVRGMANSRLDGTSVEVFAGGDMACVLDPPHGWDAAHEQLNLGTMDGFLREYEERRGAGVDPNVMAYFERQQLPVSWALADEFTTCDRWFAGLLGPTWPNRLFLWAGESGGMMSNDRDEVMTLSLNTIFHRLAAKSVPLRAYFTDIPFAALLQNFPQGTLKPIHDFYNDAEKGTLAQVTFIDPGFGSNDDHPPHHPILGQQFIGSIYAALANSPLWKNTLCVVTYDENGGFYDHVAPPEVADARPEFGQAGFRVPTMMFGPYVKRGHVSSVVYNHASVVRHLELMYGLESITPRVAASADFTDAIDLPRLAAGDWRPPPMIPSLMVDNSMIGDECRTGVPLKQPTELELLADTGFFGGLDRRKYAVDDLKMIAEVLSRYGVGGIRRNF